MFRTLLLAIAGILPGLSAMAADAPEMLPVFPEKAAFKLEPGAVSSSHELTFPSIPPQADCGVVLRFDARIATKGIGGWNPYLSVALNGVNLGKFTKTGTPRLLLRGATMKSTIEPEKEWWLRNGDFNQLMTFFAPESAAEVDPRMLSAREQNYVYTLDVTDQVHFSTVGADDRIEGGEPNRLVFHDRLAKSVADVPLVVKDIQFFYVKSDAILKMSGMTMTEFQSAAPAAKIACRDATLEVMPNGGMALAVGKERFYIESDFSYMAKPEMRYNRFNVAVQPAGRDDWKVKVAQTAPDAVTVIGTCGDYRLNRTLKLENHRIAVKDEYVNRRGDDLGIRYRHSVGRNGLVDQNSRLAGQTMATAVQFFGSANPTLFAAGATGAVGLLAEDTVSRAQLELRTVGNLQTMGSVGMGIPAGKSATLEWAIYPLHKPDYYDFINQVRRDWKVNYTIDGPYAGHDMSFPVRSATVKPLQPWHDYNSGAGLSDEAYAAKVLPAAETARKLNPAVKLLGMIETNLVAFDCRQVPWGNQLIQRDGPRDQPGVKYGIFMSPETTKLFDAFSPYADSVIRDKDGNAMYENYYTQKPFVDLMVQPEIGNHRYQTFLRQIDLMTDKLGLNGVYIDQFQPYIIGGFSENRWDGHTVELAPDGSIRRKRYSYALTGAPARAAIIKKVRDKGGIVVTNGQPMSREEQNTGVFAFQEMENDDVNPLKFLDAKPPECKWQTISHLGSPIALGIRPRRYAAQGAQPEQYPRMLTKGIITALRNGLVYYYYTLDITADGPAAGSTAICDNMFPFTPEELHEGWVRGKERIVTAVSGRYTVAGAKAPRVLYFNERGFEQPNTFPVTGKPGDWTVEVKLNDWNEVAIIIVQN